ncbi:MAG: hypothetical protein K0Q55_66 [Verrucomicrobia bacterium]|nr:hypothetical protein [Verrucomicrobiota bacterium]
MSTDTHPPSAAAAVFNGAWRFTIASLAVFGLWAFGGGWFYKNLGEAGFYLVCAIAFIGLSGMLLHGLVAQRVTLPRFYGAFTLAFMTYSVVWSACWFILRGKNGEWAGSVAGPVALAILLLRQTKTHPASIPLLLGVVALHSLGYFAGDSLYHWVKSPAGIETLSSLSKGERFKLGAMLWGLAYGLGLGSALGLVLHQIATQPPKAEAAPASPLPN